jgi:hypothetical protein
MIYMQVIKNCLLYFPKRKGLINGLVLFGYGTSSLIYNSITDYLINPYYWQINSSTGYFDTCISENVIKYLLFFNIFNGIMAIIIFLLLFEYKINPKNDKERFIQNKRKKNMKI